MDNKTRSEWYRSIESIVADWYRFSVHPHYLNPALPEHTLHEVVGAYIDCLTDSGQSAGTWLEIFKSPTIKVMFYHKLSTSDGRIWTIKWETLSRPKLVRE